MMGPLSPREFDNRNPAATPVRDRLTMIKSIYETNVLRDPVFLGSKNKLSQLRNLKEHHSGQSGSLQRQEHLVSDSDVKEKRSI
jgi:hypothetical protein